jgi:hypothetical protein
MNDLFKAKLSQYNASKGTPSTPPVNPPEAAQVLEKQTTPEVAGAPEPKEEPKAEVPKATRTRRTKAQMEADAAASTPKGDEGGDPGTSEGGAPSSLLRMIEEMRAELPEGVTVTVSVQGRAK